MNLMPNFSSYSRTCRGKMVRMKNLKNGSRPRRTLKYVASTGTKADPPGRGWADRGAGGGEGPNCERGPLSHDGRERRLAVRSDGLGRVGPPILSNVLQADRSPSRRVD